MQAILFLFWKPSEQDEWELVRLKHDFRGEGGGVGKNEKLGAKKDIGDNLKTNHWSEITRRGLRKVYDVKR